MNFNTNDLKKKDDIQEESVWQELLPSSHSRPSLISPMLDCVPESQALISPSITPTIPITTIPPIPIPPIPPIMANNTNEPHGKKFTVVRLNSQHSHPQSSYSTGSVKYQSTYSPSIDGQMTPVYRTISKNMKQTKVFPGRIRKRVVLKNGNVNLCKEHIDKRSQKYLQDMFTTMVDIQWRWNLLVFAMGFILSWLAFAVVWWLICFAHGDFEHLEDENWKPCVHNLKSFISAFLFSIETQHTIGYGSRYTNEECPEAIFTMCIQSVTGVMIQCFMVGFVFAKLSRPQKRSQTLMFSRNAIVCLRDGKLCLMFRVADVRNRSHIIGASVKAWLISRKVTQEGEIVPYYHTNIEVKFDNSDEDVFLIWPATIIHEINTESPFYKMSFEDMTREKFEMVVILEGTVESTGQSVQARSSYLPCEILWGHRFEQLVTYRRETGEYRVDYGKFNNTYEIETPPCSAKDYYEYQRYANHSHSNGSYSQNHNHLRVNNFLDMRHDMRSLSSEDTKTSAGDSGVSATMANGSSVSSC